MKRWRMNVSYILHYNYKTACRSSIQTEKKSRHETEQIRSAYLTIQMQDAVDGSTKWCDRHGEKDGIQQGVGIIEQ